MKAVLVYDPWQGGRKMEHEGESASGRHFGGSIWGLQCAEFNGYVWVGRGITEVNVDNSEWTPNSKMTTVFTEMHKTKRCVVWHVRQYWVTSSFMNENVWDSRVSSTKFAYFAV